MEGFREANDGLRTRDLRLGKPTLYQLSYVRKILQIVGFEPPLDSGPLSPMPADLPPEAIARAAADQTARTTA